MGANISDEQLEIIADRTLAESDEDQDGYISFEEFSKVSIILFNRLPLFFIGNAMELIKNSLTLDSRDANPMIG